MPDTTDELAADYWNRSHDRGNAKTELDSAWLLTRSRARRHLSSCEALLEVSAHELARSLLRDELARATLRITPDSNPWHPRLLNRLSAVVATATTAAVERVKNEDSFLREHLVPLTSYLTPDAAVAIAGQEIAAGQVVASDPRVYVLCDALDGAERLVVRHVASGISALFEPNPGSGIGFVTSKPYVVDQLAPGLPGDGARWERFAGLGIGRRIYLFAAGLYPVTRWETRGESRYSARLRDHLHAADPFHWEAAVCGWCEHQGIAWRTAEDSAFGAHPITPLPTQAPLERVDFP